MTRTLPPLTFDDAKMILRSSINVWPAAMVAEAQDVYHAAMLRTIKQIDATELVTDVIEPNARTEPEGSDTPEANKRAHADHGRGHPGMDWRNRLAGRVAGMTDLSRPNHWTPANEQQMRDEQPRLALVDLGIAIVGTILAAGVVIPAAGVLIWCAARAWAAYTATQSMGAW